MDNATNNTTITQSTSHAGENVVEEFVDNATSIDDGDYNYERQRQYSPSPTVEDEPPWQHHDQAEQRQSPAAAPPPLPTTSHTNSEHPDTDELVRYLDILLT